MNRLMLAGVALCPAVQAATGQTIFCNPMPLPGIPVSGGCRK